MEERLPSEGGPHKLPSSQGGVEGDGAKGPNVIVNGAIAYGIHECGEFGRAEEASDGFWQIGIGGSISGN
jgi:hypothetical protein